MLNHNQIVALQQIHGCGNKSIMTIGNYVQETSLNNLSLRELHELIVHLKERKILKRFPDISYEELERASQIAEYVIIQHENQDIDILSYWDSNFPGALRKTIDDTGKLNPPVLLYYKGDVTCLDMPCIAVIGTREPSQDGIGAGKFLASEFSKRGMCIVSGLAVGCDTSGHRGALDVHGKTIAILAHGLQMIFPPENKGLADEIVNTGGLLLTEYPLGTNVNRYNLVARDRLQSGLSLATLVVQTGLRGGTMHAANATLLSQKPLYTVWYSSPVTRSSEKVQGNDLLVSKGARYIKATDDIDAVVEKIINSAASDKDMMDEKSLFDKF